MLNGIKNTTGMKNEELKKRILTVAEEQLLEACIKAITMDGLSKKLGIAKKTIYRFFVSKATLIDCLINEKIQRYKVALNSEACTAVNAIEKAYLSWHILDNYISIFTHSVKDELYKQYPNTFKEVTNFINDFLRQHIKLNIERGITEGLFRKNVQAEIVARYIAGVLFNQYKDINFYPLKSSSLKVETEMLSYHLYAIATAEGCFLIEKYKNEYLAYSSAGE